MIYLLLSILLSSALFICFKWFDLRKVELLPAISGNYISCIVTGLLMNGSGGTEGTGLPLAAACLGLGILFFTVFYAMGYSSARAGVGITGAATKMSLILPVLFGSVFLGETLTAGKIAALLLVIPAIMLLSYNRHEKYDLKKVLLPFLIFTGSGIIDIALGLLQKSAGNQSPSFRITMIFSSALVASVLTLIYRKQLKFSSMRSILYGILLGIPNFFSVWAMMKALGSGNMSMSGFYLVNNPGVMLMSFLLAAILFGESVNLLRGAGILISALAIYLVLQG